MPTLKGALRRHSIAVVPNKEENSQWNNQRDVQDSRDDLSLIFARTDHCVKVEPDLAQIFQLTKQQHQEHSKQWSEPMYSEIQDLLPLVSEVNNISQLLQKHKEFQMVFIPAEYQFPEDDEQQREDKVMVLMTDNVNGNHWLWSQNKFWVRRMWAQHVYSQCMNGQLSPSDLPCKDDPFYDEHSEQQLGTAIVFPHFLAYGLGFDEEVTVQDFRGSVVGRMRVMLTPCDSQGTEVDSFVEEPTLLLGRQLHVKVSIQNVDGCMPYSLKHLKVKYRLFGEHHFTETGIFLSQSCSCQHSQVHSQKTITQNHLNFYNSGAITFYVFGLQGTNSSNETSRLISKELKENQLLETHIEGVHNASRHVDLTPSNHVGDKTTEPISDGCVNTGLDNAAYIATVQSSDNYTNIELNSGIPDKTEPNSHICVIL